MPPYARNTHSCTTLLPPLHNLFPDLPPPRQPFRQNCFWLLPLPLHNLLQSSSNVFDSYGGPPTVKLEAQACAIDGRDSSGGVERNRCASEKQERQRWRGCERSGVVVSEGSDRQLVQSWSSCEDRVSGICLPRSTRLEDAIEGEIFDVRDRCGANDGRRMHADCLVCRDIAPSFAVPREQLGVECPRYGGADHIYIVVVGVEAVWYLDKASGAVVCGVLYAGKY